MDRNALRRSPRHAGMVRRYHTWPTIQQQTIADHTWHVMRIYWRVFGPDIPPTTLSLMLWHDCGELVAGDAPFPVKSENPDLKAAHSRVELEATHAMAGEEATPVVSDREIWRAKVCDLLEMAEFGAVEVGLGSTYGSPVLVDTLEAVWRMIDTGHSHADCGAVREWIYTHEDKTIYAEWKEVHLRLVGQREQEVMST